MGLAGLGIVECAGSVLSVILRLDAFAQMTLIHTSDHQPPVELHAVLQTPDPCAWLGVMGGRNV